MAEVEKKPVKKPEVKKPEKVKKSEAGKGDLPRPLSIPWEEYSKKWDIIFGRKINKKDQNDKNNCSL